MSNLERIEELEHQLTDLRKKVEQLEQQLNEANEVIKFYSNTDQLTEEEKQMSAEKYHLVYGLKAIDYLERYGVE